MTTTFKTSLAVLITTLLTVPFFGLFAQELRLVEGTATTIDDPMVYRAYYGQLTGEPHVFSFSTEEQLTPIKAVILMPDTENVTTDISAAFIDTLHPDDPFVVGEGSQIEWQRFFDTAGRDSYLAGPVLQATVPPGNYEIRVWSSNNNSPYVLVMQGEDLFSFTQIMSRFAAAPTIKTDFFGKSAASAFMAPLLLWPIFSVLVVIAALVLLIIMARRGKNFVQPHNA